MRRESRNRRPVSTVADLMRRDVVTVHPDTSLRALIRLLVSNGINGCPVMQSGGKVVGTVSTTDLVWLSDRLVSGGPESPAWAASGREVLDEKTVRDIMTPDVFGIAPDASLRELSRFFSRTGLHRALVLADGELAGIVSISNLLGLVAEGEGPAAGRGASGPAGRETPEPGRHENLEDLVRDLRDLVESGTPEAELRLGPPQIALLEAAVYGLESMPDALRNAMQSAFQLGREHGRKEELLARLEAEITAETGRLGRAAWGGAEAAGVPIASDP